MTIHDDYEARLGFASDIRDHLAFLHETVLGYPVPAVIELGVRSGNSTAALLSAVSCMSGMLWSADVAEPSVPGEWHDLDCWRFIRGDDLSGAVLELLPSQCDVLFLDTSHDYEHTLAELRAYVPRVRAGGVALFHDTELETPPPGEVGFRPQPSFPVAKALDAYCVETGLSWDNRPGCYGLGIIRP